MSVCRGELCIHSAKTSLIVFSRCELCPETLARKVFEAILRSVEILRRKSHRRTLQAMKMLLLSFILFLGSFCSVLSIFVFTSFTKLSFGTCI